MKPDYDRAAVMAYRTLIALHVSTLPVDPVQILSFCKNTSVHTYDELLPLYDEYEEYHRYVNLKQTLLEGKDALLVHHQYPGGRSAYELFFDSHQDPRRVRFTLAHELGHIILKHSRRNDFEETEADYFASQLLAPDPLFEPLSQAGFRMNHFRTLSDLFDISCAASRMKACRPVLHVPDESLYQKLRVQFGCYIQSRAAI